MKSFRISRILMIIVLVFAAGIVWNFYSRLRDSGEPAGQSREAKTVPVEVARIEHGPIELRRTFSGTLEPYTQFVISPKIASRVERLHVDLGDIVEQGQIVADLDNDEYVQAVAQAEADLLVARANLVEAENALEIAARELSRFETLRSRGVASESQFDVARADHLSKESGREVARAQVARAEALLETARIRLGYTRIAAEWTDRDSYRVVAERYVHEGETVGTNAPLVSIVALDPITGVFFATEKDYGQLETGQAATLVTDAYPEKRFTGKIDRIAPVFGQATRQAKIELRIDNPGYRLKPGMFIRVTVVLDRIDDAVIIPRHALTSRDDQSGIFIVNEEIQTVSWHKIRTGIEENDRVQVVGEGLAGRVVTLGQQLLADGTKISIPHAAGEIENPDPAPDPAKESNPGIKETSVK